MVSYFAKKGNGIIYLSKSEQMDEMLAKGASIYSDNGDGSNTLIATPDEGYLSERPVIEQSATPLY